MGGLFGGGGKDKRKESEKYLSPSDPQDEWDSWRAHVRKNNLYDLAPLVKPIKPGQSVADLGGQPVSGGKKKRRLVAMAE